MKVHNLLLNCWCCTQASLYWRRGGVLLHLVHSSVLQCSTSSRLRCYWHPGLRLTEPALLLKWIESLKRAMWNPIDMREWYSMVRCCLIALHAQYWWMLYSVHAGWVFHVSTGTAFFALHAQYWWLRRCCCLLCWYANHLNDKMHKSYQYFFPSKPYIQVNKNM